MHRFHFIYHVFKHIMFNRWYLPSPSASSIHSSLLQSCSRLAGRALPRVALRIVAISLSLRPFHVSKLLLYPSTSFTCTAQSSLPPICPWYRGLASTCFLAGHLDLSDLLKLCTRYAGFLRSLYVSPLPHSHATHFVSRSSVPMPPGYDQTLHIISTPVLSDLIL